MSLIPFYMNPSGSDLNSGFTAADAGGSDSPSYTSTAGNFDGTSIFTPTDNQTTSTKVSIGDWVSLYNTADTAARCIAKVTNVAAGVNGAITIDTTNKFGTVPTSNSGSRACRKGGAWASPGVVGSASIFGTGTAPLAIKVNVKAATYANTTTARTWTTAGTTTVPVWWSGYKTTPGDMDSSPTTTRVAGTDIPSFTATTGAMTFAGSFNYFTSIDFQTTTTSVNGIRSTGTVWFWRCRFTATGANASSNAFLGSSAFFFDCYFSATTTAAICATFASNCVLAGCVITGGIIGLKSTAGVLTAINNLFFGQLASGTGSHAIQTVTNNVHAVVGNSAYGTASGDFWNIITAAPGAGTIAINNEVYGFLYGIDNTTGTNTGNIFRSNNAYGSMSTGNEFGLAEFQSFDDLAEIALPFVSTTDLSLLTTAVGFQKAIPRLFENVTTKNFTSVGAAGPVTVNSAVLL